MSWAIRIRAVGPGSVGPNGVMTVPNNKIDASKNGIVFSGGTYPTGR